MTREKFHSALYEAVAKFGVDILTDSKIINILRDYDAFADVPASKTILRCIVSEGYSQKIIDLRCRKPSFFTSTLSQHNTVNKPEGVDWQNKLKSYSDVLAVQNGFQHSLVNYVLDSIIFAIGWSDEEPSIAGPQGSSPYNQLGPSPIQPSNATSTGVNKNKTNSISYQQITNTQFFIMNVQPANAEVYVDGQQQFVSNGIMAVELSVGKHSYEVKANEYETQLGSVVIGNSEKTSITVNLKLVNETVWLSVTSAENDAEIFINGASYGKGKWKGLVKVGCYEIECRKHRFYSQSQTIIMKPGTDGVVNFPALEPICGNLKINVQPYGSTIIINGKAQGTTPLLVSGIQIGERMLRILTSEGSEFSQVVEVKENKVTDVNHIIPSLFLDDYEQLKIGDYYYEDGTFSHRQANGKKCVGLVFSLETSDEEKRNGWTHGQIIALKDAAPLHDKGTSWGIPNEDLLRYSVVTPHSSIQLRDTGYIVSHLNSVLNNPEFKPFLMAAQYDERLPNGKTSGWYLPCLEQWKVLHKNTYKQWDKIWHFLKITGSHGIEEYATSTLYNGKSAWIYRMGVAESHMDLAYKKQSITSGWTNVRSVASF